VKGIKKRIIKMEKAFLLDRDGTINVDTGYVRKKEDVILLKGAGEAIHLMKKAGYLVLVITNQSGVARGIMTMEEVEAVNQELNQQLKQYDAQIDKFYICPHYPDGLIWPFNRKCNCRKPQTGLFQKAIQEYEIDVKNSFAVGDRKRDVERLSELGLEHTAVIDGIHYHSLLDYTREVLGNKKCRN